MTAAKPKPAPVVAIINSNGDLVRALRQCLEDEGYAVVAMHIQEIKSGQENLVAFVERHNPAAIIYDIALPYELNWTFFQMIRQLPSCMTRPFVVTTVNKRALDLRVGQTDAIEIMGGHADDLQPTIDMVRKVLKMTPRDGERMLGRPRRGSSHGRKARRNATSPSRRSDGGE